MATEQEADRVPRSYLWITADSPIINEGFYAIRSFYRILDCHDAVYKRDPKAGEFDAAKSF